jgi:hypothetical protein
MDGSDADFILFGQIAHGCALGMQLGYFPPLTGI